MALLDLPTDVLVAIFPHLSASDFLALTSCSPILLPLRLDSSYWRTLTRRTFRIPEQPLLHADGARWQWLYKRLRTQTQVYTWGNNQKANLGHSFLTGEDLRNLSRNERRNMAQLSRQVGWPRKMERVEEIGVVADLQCGGWSTTLLNSLGMIYGVGVLNGENFRAPIAHRLTRLRFPPAYPPTTKERYEPSTAISLYSTGRSHILGLADDGKVWMWDDFNEPARLIKPLNVDLVESSLSSEMGAVTKVVAGWDRSAIYINGIGIVYWQSNLRIVNLTNDDDQDSLLVEVVIIPGTSFRRTRDSRDERNAFELGIGQVTNFIVLEGYIVFTTQLNRVFLQSTPYTGLPNETPIYEPIEITTIPDSLRSVSSEYEIRDIQGAFRSFAIFTTSGAVLTGYVDLLHAFQHHRHGHNASDPDGISNQHFELIPALQNAGVISIAFGDHHFQALHASGIITSHGIESHLCGAFGFGPVPFAQLRGATYANVRTSLSISRQLPSGRAVWFECEKRTWLEHLYLEMSDPESNERAMMAARGESETHFAVSEWIERESRAWENRLDGNSDWGEGGEIGTGAYFALKIGAAGWHSGALVLADEKKAERVRDTYITKPPPPIVSVDTFLRDTFRYSYRLVRWFLGLELWDHAITGAVGGGDKLEWTWRRQPFPRLRLPGGGEMPGTIPLTEWRGREPDWGARSD